MLEVRRLWTVAIGLLLCLVKAKIGEQNITTSFNELHNHFRLVTIS